MTSFGWKRKSANVKVNSAFEEERFREEHPVFQAGLMIIGQNYDFNFFEHFSDYQKLL